MKKYIFSLILLTLLHNSSIGQSDQFEFDLINLIKPFKGKVGVAIKNLNTNDQIEINGNEKFPMQSVFKFPLALAVFDRIDQEKLSFYKKMEINETDIKGITDYVLTFEELQAMLDAFDINIEECEELPLNNASFYGRIFARSGGLTEAVKHLVEAENVSTEFKPISCDGLIECDKALKLLKN